MTPPFSVIEFSTPALSFAQDLDVFRRAGATGIGISEEKLRDDREDFARFRDSGLRASSFFPAAGSILPSPMIPGAHEPAARVQAIAAAIRRLAPFEPACCYIATGPFGDHGADRGWDIVVEGVRVLAAEAAGHGMMVALELMHPSLSELFSFMTSLPEAIRLIDEVGSSDVAIALDLWHLSDSDDVFAQVERYARRFAAVHLDDRRDPTRSWADRVLPGDGVLDLKRILGALDAGGFDGWFELEIVSDDGRIETEFPDSLWKADPLEVIAAGRRQFLELWEKRSRGDASTG